MVQEQPVVKKSKSTVEKSPNDLPMVDQSAVGQSAPSILDQSAAEPEQSQIDQS